ncbi:5'-nucleotidase [hydrothermal vent metagenome]|uniref:5'-nucleotidase n=1 Tax=hydrothermal vent metagenome TaxID=652676 RepID=A0A3B1CR10_9ZZZZ
MKVAVSSRKLFYPLVFAIAFTFMPGGGLWNPSATIADSKAGDEPKTLTILWTNDTHGYLHPLYHKEIDEDNYLEIAKKEGKIGGWANLATLIKKLRSKAPDSTLLLDAGDTWHGTGLALFTRGSAIVKVMNALQYDAMTPGNVDFLYPKEIFMKRVEESNFPVLAANMYDMEWGDPVMKRYIIKEKAGLKIAIIGIAYQWTAKTGNREYTEGWSFGLREDEISELIKTIRAEHNPDVVIALSHMGFAVDKKYPTRVKGIDVIVGAHTHDNVYNPPVIDGTIIVQAGSHGKFLGKLDLKVANKKVVSFEHKIIRIVAKDITPDPEIKELIATEYAPFKDKLERIIGETKTMLYRRATYENTMDNFITDAYRAMSKADVAFSPAWRFGLTILPGKISVADVYGMVPSEEPVVTFTLSGGNLKAILEAALDNVLAKNPYAQLGGDLIRFSGMQVTIDESKKFGKRIVSLRIGGEPYEAEKKYTVVSANTQIHTAPTAENVSTTSKIAVEELIKFIEKKKIIAPKIDGRVKIVTDN